MLKIAFPTEDGQSISRHLGRAQYFSVVTLQDGTDPVFEQRLKPHHASHEGHDHAHGHDHELAPARPGVPLHPTLQVEKPAAEMNLSVSGNPTAVHAMFDVIADCQVLVAGGMGEPAYQCALGRGLEVFLTGEWKITAALQAYKAGTLASDLRRVHS